MKNDLNDAPAALPIACNLTGAELAQRGEEVADLFQYVQQVQELPDGYAFRFPGDDTWATQALEFIRAERACCPFFTFELVFEPQQGPIWLRMRGAGDVKEFIAGSNSFRVASQLHR